MNTEETHKENSSKLIEREQITHTPFWIIGNEEQGYRGVMGKWGITEIFKRKEQVEEYISGSQWETILKLAGIVAQDLINAEIGRLRQATQIIPKEATDPETL